MNSIGEKECLRVCIERMQIRERKGYGKERWERKDGCGIETETTFGSSGVACVSWAQTQERKWPGIHVNKVLRRCHRLD